LADAALPTESAALQFSQYAVFSGAGKASLSSVSKEGILHRTAVVITSAEELYNSTKCTVKLLNSIELKLSGYLKL
jgi:hypothetical protein